ncbi:MAG: single-stranded-DNA-specific exonuclease RecJ [Aphanocapsa sp. GSE-SYN-MK-11-07L]|nr:single-stranded-DNA-specific exonuclease RecJ [Aphanocapsa sp. GSE-SYN-MK-11-07L]
MPEPNFNWQIPVKQPIPAGLLKLVQQFAPQAGQHTAQLLWQRGICELEQLAGFLDCDRYQPTSPFELPQMQQAVERVQQARDRQQKVAIWGDFDADGITATAVLWEGLGQFLPPEQLVYWIPNRLYESHGLSRSGLDALKAQACELVVTCDNGSTNGAEVAYANQLGMEVIVTDHHTLPCDRPAAVALINPRYLPPTHPLAHLSGVAVAYKLVEALYLTLPTVPQRPLEHLLDLVAIGLIADLVELRGDCRYLAQRGIARLQTQLATQSRPGVARLLELCKKTGDRPTDISFGLGPRINAVSRIHGDARFCVELLTSQDTQRCQQLALETELANTRRQSLQKEMVQQVKRRLAEIDLSTSQAIVLIDNQWSVGVLGLVAGQIAQEYGRPTILLTCDRPEDPPPPDALARGSARSVQGIDLYNLFASQADLLQSYGGHPLAAGLSLTVANLPLFTEAINQTLRQQLGEQPLTKALTVDLCVTVADLGQDLFQELKLLEPCGMGNPVPKLLVQNCWFSNTWNKNIEDAQKQKVRYIRTKFELWDDAIAQGFPGIWWGHYKEDLPPERCDVVVELDFNTYDKRYEVRLLDVRPTQVQPLANPAIAQILDWRCSKNPDFSDPAPLQVTTCPASWDELRPWFRRAVQEQRPLAIAYAAAPGFPPAQTWQQLVGLAKYLARTGQPVSHHQLQAKLAIGACPLHLGLQALQALGFSLNSLTTGFRVNYTPTDQPEAIAQIRAFLIALQEEQFRRRYFTQVPLSTIQSVAQQTLAK